jgi:hypothetical protein
VYHAPCDHRSPPTCQSEHGAYAPPCLPTALGSKGPCLLFPYGHSQRRGHRDLLCPHQAPPSPCLEHRTALQLPCHTALDQCGQNRSLLSCMHQPVQPKSLS